MFLYLQGQLGVMQPCYHTIDIKIYIAVPCLYLDSETVTINTSQTIHMLGWCGIDKCICNTLAKAILSFFYWLVIYINY